MVSVNITCGRSFIKWGRLCLDSGLSSNVSSHEEALLGGLAAASSSSKPEYQQESSSHTLRHLRASSDNQ
ncbi:hypothetical protein YC2023_083692 [Brassica napus]